MIVHPFKLICCASVCVVAMVPVGASRAAAIEMLDRPYVEPANTPISAAPAPASATPAWEIRNSDMTLSRALARWTQGQDTRPVLWEAGKDLPVLQASYSGDFLQAVEQVMRDTQRSAYPLHACAYDNVVRIIHLSQSCGRQP